jgi:ligand-binding sensor domain-containing protein
VCSLPYPGKDGVKNDYVTCITEDHSGNLLVGTQHPRLVCGCRATRGHDSGPRNGLSDQSIRCITEDREGNLWIGGTTGGVARLKEKKLKSYTNAEGFPANSIVPITEDRAGNIWIGATCGG